MGYLLKSNVYSFRVATRLLVQQLVVEASQKDVSRQSLATLMSYILTTCSYCYSN